MAESSMRHRLEEKEGRLMCEMCESLFKKIIKKTSIPDKFQPLCLLLKNKKQREHIRSRSVKHMTEQISLQQAVSALTSLRMTLKIT